MCSPDLVRSAIQSSIVQACRVSLREPRTSSFRI